MKTCRVEFDTPNSRNNVRIATYTAITYNFFAENRDGEIRAGIQSEPAIPIAGDIQIKNGSNLITLTAADTSIDVTPATPAATGNSAYEKTINNMTKTIMRTQSPYRAFTGRKAENLLRQMLNTKEPIKFRIIGVNKALSGTGTLIIDPNFGKSLSQCGINL